MIGLCHCQSPRASDAWTLKCQVARGSATSHLGRPLTDDSASSACCYSDPVSFVAQAAMLAQLLDALGVDRVDLIANDSGGAIAQIFAVHNPQRPRTLTLTSCDTHQQPVAIAPRLRTLEVPTLIVRGLDEGFFPGARGALAARHDPRRGARRRGAEVKLFFAEDRAPALIAPLRRFFEQRAGHA